MNRSKFLKYLCLTPLIGLATRVGLCSSGKVEIQKNKTIPNQPPQSDKYPLISKLNEDEMFGLITCQSIATSSFGLDKEKMKELKNVSNMWSKIGTLKELIECQHLCLLACLARAMAEDDKNKYLNIDYVDLLKELAEKYKISNI